jgi:hypothetical protein
MPTGALTVAKKKTEPRRFNTLVRMDGDVVEKGKKVAALKGISLAEYFSDTLAPIVDRDLAKEVKKLAAGE